MNEAVKTRAKVVKDIVRDEVNALTTVSDKSETEFIGILAKLPLAYNNVPAIFRSLEAKTPQRRVILHFVSTFARLRRMRAGLRRPRCLAYERETEDLNAELTTAQILAVAPRTPQNSSASITQRCCEFARSGLPQSFVCVGIMRRWSAATAPAPVAARRACSARRLSDGSLMRPLYHKKADRSARRRRFGKPAAGKTSEDQGAHRRRYTRIRPRSPTSSWAVAR